MASLRWLFFGDLGNWLDAKDNEKRLDEVQRRVRRKGNVDRHQDERLDDLERENLELRTAIAVIFELLVSKEVLSAEEVRSVARSYGTG